MKIPPHLPGLDEPIRLWVEEFQRLTIFCGFGSQKKLAEVLGTSDRTARRYLTGERLPEWPAVISLLAAVRARGGDPNEATIRGLHTDAAKEFYDRNGITSRAQTGGTVSVAPSLTREPSAPRRILRALSRRGAVGVMGGAALGVIFQGVSDTIRASGEAIKTSKAVEADKRARAKSEPALRVDVLERPLSDSAVGWAFPKPLTPQQTNELLTDQGPSDMTKWATANGAVTITGGAFSDFGFSKHRLFLTSNWVDQVVISEIRARVKRHPPLEGAIAWRGSEGGATVVEIGFDLEEEPCRARVFTEEGRLAEIYTEHHIISLSPGEVVPLDVISQSANHYCEWDIELIVKIDGADRKAIIDHHGQAFRTTAFAKQYSQRYLLEIDQASHWIAKGPGGKLS